MTYKKFIFAGEFDGGEYCDFDTAASVLAGKDVLLGVWKADGSALLAISGQQGLSTCHTVLHVHSRHIGVGTLLEINIDFHLAIRRCF